MTFLHCFLTWFKLMYSWAKTILCTGSRVWRYIWMIFNVAASKNVLPAILHEERNQRRETIPRISGFQFSQSTFVSKCGHRSLLLGEWNIVNPAFSWTRFFLGRLYSPIYLLFRFFCTLNNWNCRLPILFNRNIAGAELNWLSSTTLQNATFFRLKLTFLLYFRSENFCEISLWSKNHADLCSFFAD